MSGAKMLSQNTWLGTMASGSRRMPHAPEMLTLWWPPGSTPFPKSKLKVPDPTEELAACFWSETGTGQRPVRQQSNAGRSHRLVARKKETDSQGPLSLIIKANVIMSSPNSHDH